MKSQLHYSLRITAAAIAALVSCAIWAPQVHAYPTWNDGAGNGCIACHGDFNSGTYVSNSDGTSWGTNLMQGHINFMGSSACNICHQPPSGTPRTPVYIGLSAGITNYPPIACLGCHGRSNDATGNCVDGNTATINPANCGMGAGLRLHHANSGVSECAGCHVDNVPVGENAQPTYYFSDSSRPSKPIDPCNLAPSPGNENKFGLTGLDNDGDLKYDQADPNCSSPTATPTSTPVPATPTPTPPPPTATPTRDADSAADRDSDVACTDGDPTRRRLRRPRLRRRLRRRRLRPARRRRLPPRLRRRLRRPRLRPARRRRLRRPRLRRRLADARRRRAHCADPHADVACADRDSDAACADGDSDPHADVASHRDADVACADRDSDPHADVASHRDSDVASRRDRGPHRHQARQRPQSHQPEEPPRHPGGDPRQP